MTRHSVLVIEDDSAVADLLSDNLSALGCTVAAERGGIRGLAAARTARPDLILVDLTLPGLGGLEICRRLRAGGATMPVIMLTARPSVTERVRCLEAGADDYLAKPFEAADLLSRVKAMFRRLDWPATGTATSGERIALGALLIDVARRQVSRDGETLALTAREFDLLHLLAAHPGRVYSRAQLLDAVWGGDCSSQEHAVNAHVNRLRAKLEPDPTRPRYVLTVWGIGYKFSDRLPA